MVTYRHIRLSTLNTKFLLCLIYSILHCYSQPLSNPLHSNFNSTRDLIFSIQTSATFLYFSFSFFSLLSQIIPRYTGIYKLLKYDTTKKPTQLCISRLKIQTTWNKYCLVNKAIHHTYQLKTTKNSSMPKGMKNSSSYRPSHKHLWGVF